MRHDAILRDLQKLTDHTNTGFPLTLQHYYGRIQQLLARIDDASRDVLPSNRDLVNRFTGSYPVVVIHAYLAGIWGCQGEKPKSDLFQNFEDYVQAEEGIVLEILSKLKYNLDAENTVQMVLGPTRPEKVRVL